LTGEHTDKPLKMRWIMISFAFVATVLSEAGRTALANHGFLPARVLIGGAATAVPQALQTLIQGTYPTD